MSNRHSSVKRHCALPLVVAFAVMSALADTITWEGSTNIVMTAATTVEVPAGRTNVIEELSGAYTLTKTGGGMLEIRYVKTSTTSVTVEEGLVRFANPRPDDIFAKAYFHVDASDLSTMVIEPENGTNFVTRWNDVDGRTDRYATLCLTEYTWRDNPQNRKPFLREGFQNGLPVVDFGSLVCRQLTDENGRALGYGAAMTFDRTSPCVKEGFTVASDVDRVSELKKLSVWDTGIYGMSYFSHETSYCFVRASGSYAGSDGWGIMHSNGNNNDYFATGQSVWYDGALITGRPNDTRPTAGFHIVRIHPTADSTSHTVFRNFAAEHISNTPSRSYGGQRIAEYVLFTNKTETGQSAMTTNEATRVNRYLRVKWFPQKISAVSVARGASLAVDDSANLTIKSLIDNGALNLALETQTNVINRGLSSLGAFLHLDASQTNTMTIVSQNGTNFITRWNDVDGGSMYVVADNSTGSFEQRADYSKRRPFLNPSMTQNGLPVADLGSAIFLGYTNSEGLAIGYGGAFKFYSLSSANAAKVREYLSVISDTEDLKTAPTGKDGPAYLAYYTGNTYNGQKEGRRGATVSGKNPALLRGSDNDVFINGGIYVDGVAKTYAYNPPDGFSVINLRPTSAVTCNVIGRSLRKNSSGQVADTYGGQRIAEYMIFTSVLDDAKRQRIYNALRNKWFGDVPATTNFYGTLSLGAAASLTVKYEAVTVTNMLSLAGTLAAPSVSAADMDVTGANATLDGELVLDGATLSFTRLQDDTWTSLSATSVRAEGAVMVSLSGSLKGMGGKSVRLIATDDPPASLEGWTLNYQSSGTRARLVLKEDGIWAEFLSPSLVILVQ